MLIYLLESTEKVALRTVLVQVGPTPPPLYIYPPVRVRTAVYLFYPNEITVTK